MTAPIHHTAHELKERLDQIFHMVGISPCGPNEKHREDNIQSLPEGRVKLTYNTQDTGHAMLAVASLGRIFEQLGLPVEALQDHSPLFEIVLTNPQIDVLYRYAKKKEAGHTLAHDFFHMSLSQELLPRLAEMRERLARGDFGPPSEERTKIFNAELKQIMSIATGEASGKDTSVPIRRPMQHNR